MNHSQSDSELSESNEGEESPSGSTTSSDSSSSTTTASDDDDMAEEDECQNDTLELAKITDEVLRLPRGLCEHAAIFHEFFSYDTWCMLPEQVQLHLQEFLPRYTHFLPPDKAAFEQQRTLQMLFDGELQRFGSTPLGVLQRQMEEGNCRPDVLQLRQSIEKSRRREQRFQKCEFVSQLAKDLFVSRERLLRSVYKSAPDTAVHAERLLKRKHQQPSTLFCNDTRLSAVRAHNRYTAELAQIVQQLGMENLSADEEEADEPLKHAAKALGIASTPNSSGEDNAAFKASTAAGISNNSSVGGSNTAEKYIFGTLFKRRHGIEDEETIRADQHAKQPRLSNRNFKQCLLEHKRRKLTEPTLPDFETSDIRLRDVCARAQIGGNFKRIFATGKTPGRKPKSKLNEPPALVPIQPLRKMASESNEVNAQQQQLAPTNGITRLAISQQHQIHAEHQAYNIMDGEVELQQEEVETFGTSEENLPTFLIAHDITARKETQATTLQQQHTKWPHAQQQQQRVGHQAVQQHKLLPLEQLPKLEPITATVKPLHQSKQNQNMPTMLTLTPLKKATATTNSTASATINVSHLPPVNTTATSYIANAELIQETHACFFALIRDFFCATPNHRMKYDDLKEKIDVWLCNPITALNDWYAQAENWSSLLNSAINFLAGDFAEQPDEYVPYIELKTQLNIYQWIGAGRDSDARLTTLCNYWMEHRHEITDKCFAEQKHNEKALALRRTSTDIEDASIYESGVSPPPPPRCPTTWTVRAATAEEVVEFKRQERERFENPHRAYTYRLHGYESVVGPVKGIYSQILALTKARGHSMMIGDRPNFVTILTLVRDATARLPNGEGTRADISELLKCSQYINRDAAENVLQTIVSGALDRMHTEHDPCVRYDPKRKIWIYLHRNRSEGEFERMHQQYQGLSKNKKQTNRKQKTKILSKDGADVDAMTASVLTNSSTATAAALSSANSNPFSLPALVPSNPIIVNNQTFISQQQQHQTAQQQQTLARCPPVPPLKYNIPQTTASAAANVQQQQKSLLKTTLHTQRQTEAVGEKLLSNQKTTLRTLTGSNTVSLQTPTSNAAKQYTFTMPQAKAVAAGNNTTPIIVATPSGLQTVHVSNATSVTPPTATVGVNMQLQSATVGGKKVALNKPIIINQITQQGATAVAAATKTKTIQQTIKLHQQQSQATPKQQQTHSYIIPISSSGSSGTTATTAQTMRNIQTIYMEQATPQQQQQTQSKSIIRLVPTINSSGMKTLMPTTVVNTQQQQQQQQQQTVKQPMQIIGQRVIANTTVRSQTPQKTIGGISIINTSGSVGSTTNTGAIVKMSPQTFAALQQKQQGQHHIVVKQASAGGQQHQQQTQQRVIVGKTAIIAQPATHTTIGKNITLQQVAVTHKSNANAGAQTVGSNSNKIQTINASNLTPQQQRVFLQNLKQQQQQTPRNQAVTIVPQRVTAAVQTAQPAIGSNKSVQQQHTSSKSDATSTATTTGTRVLTTSTGQIISLDSLLQKQGGALKITGGATATGGGIKTTQNTNIIQLAPTSAGAGPTQYAIVSQPRNIISLGGTQRIITTQAIGNTTVITTPATTATAATLPKANTGRILNAGGQQLQTINVAQMTHTKAFGKATTATTTIGGSTTSPTIGGGGGGHVRVVNAGTQNATSFNIANIHGKQVVFTTNKPTANIKTMTVGQQVQQHQQQQRQNPAGVIIGGQAINIQGNLQQKLNKGGAVITHQQQATQQQQQTNATQQMQTVIVGNQILRVQQLPTNQSAAGAKVLTQNRVTASGGAVNTNVVAGNALVVSSNELNAASTATNMPKTLVLGTTGQTIRLQPSAAAAANKNVFISSAAQQQHATVTTTTKTSPTTASRVVLAVQGGGQIFLSPSFQGGALNLKSLQSMKLVSLAQATTTTNTNTNSGSNMTKELQQQAQMKQDKLTSAQQQQQQSILKNSGGIGGS